jgi:hypothetical protein
MLSSLLAVQAAENFNSVLKEAGVVSGLFSFFDSSGRSKFAGVAWFEIFNPTSALEFAGCIRRRFLLINCRVR